MNHTLRGLYGLDVVKFSQKADGPAQLVLKTEPMNLSAADRGDHMVDVEIRIGSFVVQQSRLWTLNGTVLGTR
jgi:hypothetical protein